MLCYIVTGVLVDKVGFFLMVGWEGGVRVLWNGGTQVYVRVQPAWAGKLQVGISERMSPE